MKIDIYKSVKSGNKYLSVPDGTDVTKLNLPSGFDPDLLSLSPFKSSLDIQPSDQRAALDSADVIQQITDKGYAVHGATTTVTITQA